MKFILIENPEYVSSTVATHVENGFILLNLTYVKTITIAPKTGKAMLETEDGKLYNLKKEETISLLKHLNYPDIIRPSDMSKLHKSMVLEAENTEE